MRNRRANIVGVALLGALALATAVAAQTPAHAALTWQGNGTCLTCHEQQGRDMHASAHYQWQGYAPYLTTGPALQGKLNTSFNSYCINILGNWGECSNCHVGRGLQPSTTATTEQLQDIDCLVCHQKNYKRVKVNGAFVPDTASMTITMDQAVQTVHLPERQNCIACHAKGGGGDNYKRGDLALAHANTADRNFDVHMATTGANLRCQSCHKVQNHLIAGRGSDLRETDYDADMSCTTCHTTKASATGHSTSAVNRHVARVACQTCHIRAYGRNAADTAASEATEVARDWSRPTEVSPGSFRPTSTMANNVKPVYRFWNKYSSGYSLGEPAVFDASTSAYATSRPIGSIDDSTGGGKLYPFKYKTSFQPMASAPAALVAVDTSVFFKTGDLAAATVAGLANMGLSTTQPTSMVTTDTYQLITHTVTPAANVLQCAECHSSTATQMSLPALGYVLKGTISSVCSQCHSARQSPGWQSVHDIHVTQRHYDCSRCHSFTRPERNSTSTTYTLSVTKAGTGAGTVTSSPAGINCGTTCSASYSSGTTVTLTAAAASGSAFAGWSGACSGTGTCTVTMSAARSVTRNLQSVVVVNIRVERGEGRNRGRHRHQLAGGHQLRDDLQRDVHVGSDGDPDGGCRVGLDLRGLERRVQRHRHVHRHDECGTERDGNLQSVVVVNIRVERGESRHRRRHRHQLAGGHQLRDDLQRELHVGNDRDPGGGGRVRLDLRGLERRVQRHGHVHRHDECGPERDRNLQPFAGNLHVERGHGGGRDGRADEFAGRHQLRNRVQRDLRVRDSSGADGRTGVRLVVCGLERRVQRYRDLHRHDERSTERDGDLQAGPQDQVMKAPASREAFCDCEGRGESLAPRIGPVSPLGSRAAPAPSTARNCIVMTGFEGDYDRSIATASRPPASTPCHLPPPTRIFWLRGMSHPMELGDVCGKRRRE